MGSPRDKLALTILPLTILSYHIRVAASLSPASSRIHNLLRYLYTNLELSFSKTIQFAGAATACDATELRAALYVLVIVSALSKVCLSVNLHPTRLRIRLDSSLIN